MRNILEQLPTGNFVALYNEGSGANVFCVRDDKIYDAENEFISNLNDVVDMFLERGYFHYFDLPNDFKFWFEENARW
jgi:hypothetical protein